VLVKGGYVAQRHLAQDWQELTGDSLIVDIREVDAIYGLKYTLKYLKKAPTVSGHADEYNEVLKGTRLVQAWGSWYGEVRAKEEDEAPKLVCAVCGHSDWIVILQKPGISFEEFRAKHEVIAFFEAKARAG
jgi:predicted dinucleotide-binding enzyme